MEFEFDKEMDALLRQTARGETARAAANEQTHLDADAISAFAENALPERAKQRYTLHFADCDRCRKILTNVILSDSETEIVVEKQTTKVAVVAATPTPWYRKLFAYPNLAFTMGALILAFSGLITFVVLQNDSRNAEVSQISERQPSGKGMSSDGDAPAPEANFSNSSSTSSVSNTNTATLAQSNAAMANVATGSAARNTNTSAAPNKPVVSANQAPKEEPRRETDEAKNKTAQPENGFTLDGADAEKRERVKEDKQETETADAAANPAPKPQAPTAALSRSSVRDEAPSAKKKAAENDATTGVGGKTFKRANGVWTDSAYRGQATTNITRGTNEYKKLDAGLRSIAENLGGTVIVVWKEKAYRIQ